MVDIRSLITIINENENKEEFEDVVLSFETSDLEPVMSEKTIDLHYGVLTKNYIKNANETHDPFQEAGAFLHTIWWDQFKEPNGKEPTGLILDLINEIYGDFTAFKDVFKNNALRIQGSGWCALLNDGSIVTIKNHQKQENIVLLLDMWEHSYILDYGADKKKYIDNFWRIIDWLKINDRLR